MFNPEMYVPERTVIVVDSVIRFPVFAIVTRTRQKCLALRTFSDICLFIECIF